MALKNKGSRFSLRLAPNSKSYINKKLHVSCCIDSVIYVGFAVRRADFSDQKYTVSRHV